MNRFFQKKTGLWAALIFLVLPGLSVHADDLNVYFVGNSLINRIKLQAGLRGLVESEGHTLSDAYPADSDFAQIVAGANLYYHWYHGVSNQDPPVEYYIDDFGPELRSNVWDALVLQAYAGSKPWYWNTSLFQDPKFRFWQDRPREEGDIPMVSNFVDQCVNQGISGNGMKVYIYSQWPLVPGATASPDYAAFDYKTAWDEPYDDPTKSSNRSRDYWRQIHQGVASQWSGQLTNGVMMIPFGDALYELNERLRANPLDGFKGNPDVGAEVSKTFDDMEGLFLDGNHLAPGAPQYFKALVFYSVLYQKDPRGLSIALYNDLSLYYAVTQYGYVRITPEWITLLQDVAWQVSATHFLSGLRDSLTPGDANLDGAVDSTDYDLLMAAWGRTDVDEHATGIGWRDGDFDGDGDVDQDDLDIYQAQAGEVDPDYELPFEELFEILTAGALDGQHGWIGGAGAVVQSATARDTQALELTEDSASHAFIGSPTNIWITFYVQGNPCEAEPGIDADSVAVAYVNAASNLVAYSNQTPVELSAEVSNGWNKVEIFADYVSKVWNISLNDTVAATNLGFYSDQPAFSAIKFVELSTTAAYIDDIGITDSLDDADRDGLPDDWEETWFGDLDANPDDLAANSDYTVWQCYIAGFNPTDPDADFLIADFRPLTSESILQWQNAPGRVYTIYWSSNLLNGFQTLETNFTGGTFTDAVHSAEEKGFYKIDVQLSN